VLCAQVAHDQRLPPQPSARAEPHAPGHDTAVERKWCEEGKGACSGGGIIQTSACLVYPFTSEAEAAGLMVGGCWGGEAEGRSGCVSGASIRLDK
jgi:hypothetical protein